MASVSRAQSENPQGNALGLSRPRFQTRSGIQTKTRALPFPAGSSACRGDHSWKPSSTNTLSISLRTQNGTRHLEINFPAAVVLHGPPGCGKTFAVERLVEYLDWPIFHIDSNSVGSPYIHETSRKVGEIFTRAMDAAPSMIVIDEMESYLSDRQIHQSTGLHHVEEVAEFLRLIPQANQRNVLVIGMTNRLDMIDSAILRRGRFDHIVEVGMPSAIEVSDLVESLLSKVPVEGEIDADKVV